MDYFEKQKLIKALSQQQNEFRRPKGTLPKYLHLKGTECLICESSKRLVAHHLSYDPLKIVTLCQSCHQYLHSAVNYRYWETIECPKLYPQYVR
jgi:hypothetical protein